MNSRERVIQAMNHQQPDRVPLDLGASSTSGMHVSSVYLLRQALNLDRPDEPVKVIEPYQMLGEIKTDLLEAVGADVVGVQPRKNMFGFENKGWKPWTLHDGTPVLVPEAFNTEPEPDGSLLMYPEGIVTPCQAEKCRWGAGILTPSSASSQSSRNNSTRVIISRNLN